MTRQGLKHNKQNCSNLIHFLHPLHLVQGQKGLLRAEDGTGLSCCYVGDSMYPGEVAHASQRHAEIMTVHSCTLCNLELLIDLTCVFTLFRTLMTLDPDHLKI